MGQVQPVAGTFRAWKRAESSVGANLSPCAAFLAVALQGESFVKQWQRIADRVLTMARNVVDRTPRGSARGCVQRETQEGRDSRSLPRVIQLVSVGDHTMRAIHGLWS